MTSVTSSLAPGMVENSCRTPAIRTDVTAAPSMDDKSTRRSEFPRVSPKPRSSGSAKNFPYVLVRVSSSHSSRLGFWNPLNFCMLSFSLAALLRIQGNHQLLLNRDGHLLLAGKRPYRRLEIAGVHLEPGGHAALLCPLDGAGDLGQLATLGLDLDHVSGLEQDGRNRDPPPVHAEVPVSNQHPRLGAGGREPQTMHD